MKISTEFLNQLGRFSVVLKKRVHSQYQGTRQSQQTGSGLVFQDFREYAPGDDLRKIDWRLYARTEKHFIRRFEEEKNLTIHILLDSSASMDFGDDITKFEYGAHMGLGFAYTAAKNNEKFSIATFADRLNPIKPQKGRNQVASILDHLNNTKPKGKSSFKRSLSMYKELVKTKSLIVIISDFLLDIDEISQTLFQYKRSDIILVHVMDPVEFRFSLEGDFTLKDAEEDIHIKTLVTERLRDEYKQRLSDHLAKLRKMADKIGAKYVGVSTDASMFDSFYRIIQAK